MLLSLEKTKVWLSLNMPFILKKCRISWLKVKKAWLPSDLPAARTRIQGSVGKLFLFKQRKILLGGEEECSLDPPVCLLYLSGEVHLKKRVRLPQVKDELCNHNHCSYM